MKLNFPWQKIQVINAGKEFAALGLWEQFDNMDFFVVETPLEEPVVACIMGAGSQEFGLCVFRGPDAFEQPFLLSQGKDALVKKGNTLGFSMEYYRDMHYEEKKWFKACNFRAKKGDWLPSFILVRPGEQIETLEKDHDIKLVLYILKGIVSAHESGEFDPVTTGRTGPEMLTIQVSGKAEKPTVIVTKKAFAGSKELLAYCNNDEHFEPIEPPDVSRLPRLEETWVLVTRDLSLRDDRDDVCVLAIAEEDSGLILHSDVTQMDGATVFENLIAVFGGDNVSESIGVPEKIVVADKLLFEVLCKPLKHLGVEAVCESGHPVAKEIRHSLENDLPEFGHAHPVRHLDGPDIDLSVVPEADDLSGWKAASQVLTNRFIDFWNETETLRKTRPAKRFFGDDDWEYYLEEFREMLVLPSYVTWSALCYRARKKDMTHAERLLAGEAGELAPALRVQLEAMNAAWPSLYQVVNADGDAGTIVLRDLLLGGELTVHDYGLSASAQPGWIGPFWISRAGNFHFLDIAGPIFSTMDAMDVIEALQAEKLPAKPTRKWLRDNAHVFGRLWQLYERVSDIRGEGPALVNTDGDPLEMITVQFGYSDRKAVRKALDRHNDINYDEAEDAFVWFKDATGKKPMDMTLLGRVYFEDGLLKAEVNSAQRLDGIRELLEEAGAVYHTHESQDPAEAMKEVRSKPASLPLSEDDIPEEVRKAIEEKIKNHYIDWLDSPIPALDNKTPRQAAKTAKGAQQVRIMIETIPEATGNTGAVTAPKKAMLKELGLEGVN